MSAPTTPAPMPAERLNEIRAVHQSDWARELYIHIDALTARIAELELALGEERSLTVDQIELCADLDAAVERALAAEAKLETARRDALEEAAEVCDGVARRCNERGMYGVGVLFEASKAIRALKQKDTAP